MKKNNGFTLIEALVTISIIGVVGFILSDILIKSFQSNDKTKAIGTIKQNGLNAMEYFTKEIRTADAIVCAVTNPPDPNNPKFIVLDKSGTYIRFNFYEQNSTSVNGKITLNYPSPNPTNPANECLNDAPPLNSEQTLTNTDLVSGVSLTIANITGSFTVSDIDPNIMVGSYNLTGYKDWIGIEFTLNKAVNAPQGFEKSIGYPESFKTTVNLR